MSFLRQFPLSMCNIDNIENCDEIYGTELNIFLNQDEIDFD